ncbi:helix-turn-helix domain-containing protein [Thermoflexus hugenholtzii]|jgi:hypothetical protein|uniref:HTH iclR-type domain-containing protein n=1 Tax=Thermoflexus hugenholtzii JAD2 TaxID=877466 RepID=A0A212Q0N3_9CHLR|nr:hypothetical protein [Thermoflexus hugenholtzii]SNB52774.1 hypothetical protein SAMN02746019_00023720 [Thermoflexus hugenholtzii JAD2]
MGALTRRQREFLAAFLRLHRRWRRPLHYAVVARALRIGRATAYEMLALLERIGLVERRYESLAGPGRPRVVFRPTAHAQRILTPVWDAAAWRSARARVQQEIHTLQARMDPGALLRWLLTIPEEAPAAEGMARMAAGLMLVFRLLEQPSEEERTPPPRRALDLGALAGLSAALVALTHPPPQQIRALLAKIRWFQEQWERLDPMDRRRLSHFAAQILQEENAHE